MKLDHLINGIDGGGSAASAACADALLQDRTGSDCRGQAVRFEPVDSSQGCPKHAKAARACLREAPLAYGVDEEGLHLDLSTIMKQTDGREPDALYTSLVPGHSICAKIVGSSTAKLGAGRIRGNIWAGSRSCDTALLAETESLLDAQRSRSKGHRPGRDCCPLPYSGFKDRCPKCRHVLSCSGGCVHGHRPAQALLCRSWRPIMHAVLLFFQLVSCAIITWTAWDYDHDKKVCVVQQMVRVLVPWVPIVVFWPHTELYHERISLLVRCLRLSAMALLVVGSIRPLATLNGRKGLIRGLQVLLEALAFPLVVQGSCQCQGLENMMQMSQFLCQAVIYPLCYQVAVVRSAMLSGLEAALLVLAEFVTVGGGLDPPPASLAMVSFTLSVVLVYSVDMAHVRSAKHHYGRRRAVLGS